MYKMRTKSLQKLQVVVKSVQKVNHSLQNVQNAYQSLQKVCPFPSKCTKSVQSVDFEMHQYAFCTSLIQTCIQNVTPHNDIYTKSTNLQTTLRFLYGTSSRTSRSFIWPKLVGVELQKCREMRKKDRGSISGHHYHASGVPRHNKTKQGGFPTT